MAYENYRDLTDQLTRQIIRRDYYALTEGLPEQRRKEIRALIDQIKPRNDIDVALHSYFQLYNLTHLDNYLTDIRPKVHESARKIIHQGMPQLKEALESIPTRLLWQMPYSIHKYILDASTLVKDYATKSTRPTLTYEDQKKLFESQLDYQKRLHGLFHQNIPFKKWPNHDAITTSVEKQITTEKQLDHFKSENSEVTSNDINPAVATAYILTICQLISQTQYQLSRYSTSNTNHTARENFVFSLTNTKFDLSADPRTQITDHASQVIGHIDQQVFDDRNTITQIGRMLSTLIKIILPILLIPDMIEAHQRCGNATNISLFCTRSQKEANYLRENLKTLKEETLDEINHPPKIEMAAAAPTPVAAG